MIHILALWQYFKCFFFLDAFLLEFPFTEYIQAYVMNLLIAFLLQFNMKYTIS